MHFLGENSLDIFIADLAVMRFVVCRNAVRRNAVRRNAVCCLARQQRLTMS